MKKWRFTVTSHAVDVPPMVHIEGDLTRDSFEWTELGEAPAAEQAAREQSGYAGCDVRVRPHYPIAEKAALNFDLVTAPFWAARRVVLDPVPTHTRAIRAPEIVEAPTEEAKVRAFVTGAGTTWTPGLDQKFAMLQLPDGATFLNQLEVDLTGTPVEADAPPERPMEVFQ